MNFLATTTRIFLADRSGCIRPDPPPNDPPGQGGGEPRRSGSATVKTKPTIVHTVPCMPHDMKCTTEADGLGFVRVFGKILKIVLPHECCVQHDINLYCGPCPGESDPLINISAAFAACVTEHTFKTIMYSVPWWQGGIVTGFALATATAPAIFAITLSAIHTFTLIALIGDPKLFPRDGSTKKSCLCGGTEVTRLCSDDKVELCNQTRKRGRRCDTLNT
jgi:hypothetical protein